MQMPPPSRTTAPPDPRGLPYLASHTPVAQVGSHRARGQRFSRICGRVLLVLIAAILTVAVFPQKKAAAASYDYTDPQGTGCANTGSLHFFQALNDPYGYNLATLSLGYSSYCRTIWSRLYYFTSTNAEESTYPWVNRESPPYPYGDTSNSSAMCYFYIGSPQNGVSYSLQLDDANYLGHAWGGENNANCGPGGSLVSYTAVGPY